jgi:hypothetical protein
MSRSTRLRCVLLGRQGELMGDAPDAVDGGEWLDGYNFALAGPDLRRYQRDQRNIIAERVLGLPR